MNIKLISCLIAVLLLAASVFILMDFDDESDTSFENSDEFKSAISTNIPTIILSNDATKIAQSLSFGTNAISTDSGMPDISDQKAVFIDRTWTATKNQRLVNEYIIGLLDRGIIVTSIGSYSVFSNNPLLEFIAFMRDCDTYSIYKSNDGSRYICHSIDDGGSDNAIEMTYCWINTQINRKDADTAAYIEGPCIEPYDLGHREDGRTSTGYSSNHDYTMAGYHLGSSIRLSDDKTPYVTEV